jgi:acetyl esterase
MKKRAWCLCCVAAIVLLNLGIGTSEAQRGGAKPPSRAEIRRMIRELDSLAPDVRKARIREIYEKYGKPMLARAHKTRYQSGRIDGNTKVFDFKQVPERTLKIYVRFPDDWKETDRRPAIVFWHGGGFTQGGANQFYAQAEYFNARGMVAAQPEYRIRDVDGTLPHRGIEDAISAMRWFRKRAEEFGVDADRIAVGGGSAGGCIASVLGTADAETLAKLGCIGPEDDPSIPFRPCAMLLYNPFVDFFEPLNDRHMEEECLMLGEDPIELTPLYHEISAIERLTKDSPPNIIMFGTRDAFYPQSIRWIVKCRELGVKCHDYVYKGEVHSWFNNSPHIEYTTENVDKFLVEIGLLSEEPKVELPHKEINPNRLGIQQQKYAKKTDWDEQERFQRYVKEHNIKVIPYKHYESK